MPKTTAGYVGLLLALLTTATIVGVILKLLGVLSWGWGAIVAPWLITVGVLTVIVVGIVLLVTYADASWEDEEDCL